MRHLPAVDRLKRYERDETNTFQLHFLSSMQIVGVTGLGGLWALEWEGGLWALEWASIFA